MLLAAWLAALVFHAPSRFMADFFRKVLRSCVSNKKNRTQRGKGDTPSKRGSSLRNYLDQNQSNEFGQKEDIGSYVGTENTASAPHGASRRRLCQCRLVLRRRAARRECRPACLRRAGSRRAARTKGAGFGLAQHRKTLCKHLKMHARNHSF